MASNIKFIHAVSFLKDRLILNYQLVALIVLAFLININTLSNDYALDDAVVLTQNSIVKKGVSGIPEMLTSNYLKGYTTDVNLLSGSRYRPLTLVAFALEYQFFGEQPFVSHLINLLLYLMLIVLLFKFLRMAMPISQQYLIFITVLIFSIHPVHTEVIANVKGRDELLAFILLLSALIFEFKFLNSTNRWNLFISTTFFFLSLLTKETSITFLAVIPMLFYFFLGLSIRKSLIKTFPYLVPLFLYLALRYWVVGFSHFVVADVSNSPYIMATAAQAFATKIFIIVKYIGLLIFPFTLTSEYGFNQIPYVELSSFKFIFSSFLLVGLIVVAILNFNSRSILGFSIFYFFITISVATNLFFDFGAPLAERMLFIPSLSFCLLLAFFANKCKKYNRTIFSIFIITLFSFFSFKTVARNAEWKNNETLFITDVKKSPESSRLNLFVCQQYILKASLDSIVIERNSFLDSALLYGAKSLKIQPDYSYSYLRMGLAWYYKGNYYKAADYWIKAMELDKQNADGEKWTKDLSNWFNEEGLVYLKNNMRKEALACFNYALQLNHSNDNAKFNRNALLK